MTSLRYLVAGTLTTVILAAVLVAQKTPASGTTQADAANAFLASLSAEQRAKATFGLDDPHRTAWYFTPQQTNKQSTRKGVRIDGLDAKQKAAALDLLKAGLSAKGYEQASTIMSLEGLLAELEGTTGANTRNPNWYFVSIFGSPAATGTWGWRFEGHHLSVNVTLNNGEVVDATPMTFASNPAVVKSGPRKGLEALPEIEEMAKALIASFDAKQSAQAKQAKQFSEVREGHPDAKVGEPVGIPQSQLTDSQKAQFEKLILAYSARMPSDVAAAEWKRINDAGLGKVFFGYCIEENKPGKPFTYRIQGPTFVVEFVNVQADAAKNPANHIHSAWRRLPADFSNK